MVSTLCPCIVLLLKFEAFQCLDQVHETLISVEVSAVFCICPMTVPGLGISYKMGLSPSDPIYLCHFHNIILILKLNR